MKVFAPTYGANRSPVKTRNKALSVRPVSPLNDFNNQSPSEDIKVDELSGDGTLRNVERDKHITIRDAKMSNTPAR
jgi:hypothetical protein